MELYCQAPNRKQPFTICGWRIGDYDRELVLIGLLKNRHLVDRIFPAPRKAWRCPHCEWWSVYEPRELPNRR